MTSRLPLFWMECGLCVTSAASLALTLVWPRWIEQAFGVVPDSGDGAAERSLALALAALAVLSAMAARRTWRTRLRAHA
jgi:hypothetical protein